MLEDEEGYAGQTVEKMLERREKFLLDRREKIRLDRR